MKIRNTIATMVFTASCFMLVAQNIPKVAVSQSDGFVDIDIPISNYIVSPDGILNVKALGKVENLIIGFSVEVLPTQDPKKVNGSKATFYWGKVRYKRTGVESDNFVNLVAKLYKQKITHGVMPNSINFSAVGLDEDPRKLVSSPARMKLFYEPDSQEKYAEIYTNIDLQAKRLEFHEKDPEYRPPLLKALLR